MRAIILAMSLLVAACAAEPGERVAPHRSLAEMLIVRGLHVERDALGNVEALTFEDAGPLTPLPVIMLNDRVVARERLHAALMQLDPASVIALEIRRGPDLSGRWGLIGQPREAGSIIIRTRTPRQ